MRTDFIVLPAEIRQHSVSILEIVERMCEDFSFHCTVETLNLTLGLRVQDSSVNWENVQIHQETLKHRAARPGSPKLHSVVREDGIGKTVLAKSKLEAGNYAGCGEFWLKVDAIARVVIQDIQWETALSVTHKEISLEIRLPQIVALFALEALCGRMFEGRLF